MIRILIALALMAAAPLTTALAALFWWTAEDRTANDHFVLFIYACTSLLFALSGVAMFADRRRSDA
jgi:hypothetical protein